MSVFGVAIAGFGILDVECGIDLVADDLRERGDIDGVGRTDVHRFAVGTVVGRQPVVGI